MRKDKILLGMCLRDNVLLAPDVVVPKLRCTPNSSAEIKQSVAFFKEEQLGFQI
jgi:hypothetical protein